MKKEDVRIGSTYSARISGDVVPVRITEEKWSGEKHVGWIGLNTKTKRPVRIKSAQKLRAELTEQQDVPPPAPKPDAPAKPVKEKKAKAPKAPKPEKVKRLSCIDAAAQVLKAAGKPMKAKEMIEAMAAQGLWSSPAGKTPEASLYAAIIREIAAKKKEARFKKTDRGSFEHSGVEAAS